MIRTERAHLNVVALTDPGLSGKENEDRYAVTSYRLAEGNPTPSVFAIVADGIGGHKAGEQAAEIAVNIISHAVSQSDGLEPLNTLEIAVTAASEAIARRSEDDTQHLGMGTTCACAWVIDRRLYTVSVGDSRIYLLRGKVIRQLTTDHTWIQEAIDKGILKADQTRDHPNLHVIRRYLGSPQPPKPDIRLRLRGDESDTQAEANQGLLLKPGDKLLLCTDGLTDLVTNEEIMGLVRGMELEAATQTMIDLANARGSPDNITVVLFSVPGKPERRKRDSWPWIFGGMAGLLVFLAAITGVLWMILQPTPRVTPTVSPQPTSVPSTNTPWFTATPTVTPLPNPNQPTYTPWPTNTP